MNSPQTLLDTPSGGMKNFDTKTDVVYGKFQDGVNKLDPISDPNTDNLDPESDLDEILTPEDASYEDDYPDHSELEEEYYQESENLGSSSGSEKMETTTAVANQNLKSNGNEVK